VILTPEKKTHRTETTCTCGSVVQQVVGSSEFFIGPKKIVINNVPHFYCSYCNKSIFDSKLPIDDLLKYAYINNLSDIDWNDRSLYL